MKLASILACVFSGVFLGAGWWLFGDSTVQFKQEYPNTPYVGHWVVPGVLSTVAAILMNFIDPSVAKEKWEAKLWLFCWLTCGFVGIGIGLWILIADSLIGGGTNWTGIALLIQPMLIVLAGILFFLKEGVKETAHY